MHVVFLEIDLETEWAVASLGPAFIGAFLRSNGHTVELLRVGIDCTSEALAEEIRARRPGLIGISLTSRQWLRGREVIGGLRALVDIPVIAGGLHATFASDAILAAAGFDYACLGEGERAMLELVELLEQRADPAADPVRGLKNIRVKADLASDRVQVSDRVDDAAPNPGRSLPQGLHPPFAPIDELPFMARDLLDEHHGVVHMTTQRGCPYPCTYCAARQFSDLYGSYADFGRRRSVDNVLEELAAIRDAGPLSYVIFLDDTFTINHAWLRDFLPRYRDEIKVPFSIHARVETVNEPLLALLKASGCAHITYGVESGSERFRREVMLRQAPNAMFREVFAWTKRAGILATANYIVGTPGETPADVEETFALHRDLAPDDFGYFVFYPYPGTPLYHECQRQGYLPDDYYELPAVHRESILDFPSMSREEIGAFYDRFTAIRKADSRARLEKAGADETLLQTTDDMIESNAQRG